MKIKNVRYKNLMGQGSYQLIRPMGDLSDHPEFQPHFSPAQMLAMGVFEGLYLNSCQDEYLAEWFKNARLSEFADPAMNYFGVKSRTSLQHWRAKGWSNQARPAWMVRMVLPILDGPTHGNRRVTNLPLAQRWQSRRPPPDREEEMILHLI